MAETIRVRLAKSKISTNTRQRETVRGLGLRKIGDVRVLEKTPAVLGMVRKVCHLVEVQDEKDAKE